ncbi:GDYXXLXY domain-containing protein, partial [Paenibacillus sp. TAF58]
SFTVWYEKRHRSDAIEPIEANSNYAMNRWIIALLVLLQVMAMSLQIGKSEWLLAHGQLIKLQLEPLDPRSLIQGDYVRLRYSISEPPLFADKNDEAISKGKITIVLAPNLATGVYEYRRVYTNGEALAPGEVRLNGNKIGYEGIEYGIETYFIPEGTGHEYERNAKFAEVKVSAGGDAILVRLLLQPSVVQ